MPFDSVLHLCEEFHGAHLDWEAYEYLSKKHPEIQTFCKSVVIQDSELLALVERGTKKGIQSLLETLNTEVHARFTIPLLTEILADLHRRESLQAPFSKDLVTWFRETGWEFPQFSYERATRGLIWNT